MQPRKPKHCSRTTNHGRVAAYCPICRDIQPLDVGLERIGTARETRWVCSCIDCAARFPINPSEWDALASTDETNVQALLRQTAPDYLYGAYEQCIADVQLASGLAPPSARTAAIKTALAIGCSFYVDHSRADYFSGPRSLLLFFLAFGLIAGLSISEGKASDLSDSSRYAARAIMIACAVGAAGLFSWWGWSREKAAANYARYLVARSLRSFSPSVEEISACVRAIALAEPRVNKFAQPDQVYAQMSTMTDRSWSNMTPDVVKAHAEQIHKSRVAAFEEVHV